MRTLFILNCMFVLVIGCGTLDEKLTRSVVGERNSSNYKRIEDALKDGANPNAQINGVPIVEQAIIDGNDQAVRLLIKYDADIKKHINMLSFDLLKYVLNHSPQISVTVPKLDDTEKNKRVDYLIYITRYIESDKIKPIHFVKTIISYLDKNKSLDNKIRAELIYSLALTPRHQEEFESFLLSEINKNPSILFLKLKNGDTVENALAVNHKSLNCLEIFKNFIQVSEQNKRNKVMFSVVTSKDAIEYLEILIDKGVDLNIKNDNGDTLLLHISKSVLVKSDVQEELIKLLLSHNADPEIKDKYDKTLFSYINVDAEQSADNFLNSNFTKNNNTESEKERLYRILEEKSYYVPFVCNNVNTYNKIHRPMKITKSNVKKLLERKLESKESILCALNLLKNSQEHSKIIIPIIFSKIFSDKKNIEELLIFALHLDKECAKEYLLENSGNYQWDTHFILVVGKLIEKKVFPLEFAENVFLKMDDSEIKTELYKVLKLAKSKKLITYEEQQEEKKAALAILEKQQQKKKDTLEKIQKLENEIAELKQKAKSIGPMREINLFNNFLGNTANTKLTLEMSVHLTSIEERSLSECTNRGNDITENNILACPIITKLHKQQLIKALRKAKKEERKRNKANNKKLRELEKIENEISQKSKILFRLKWGENKKRNVFFESIEIHGKVRSYWSKAIKKQKDNIVEQLTSTGKINIVEDISSADSILRVVVKEKSDDDRRWKIVASLEDISTKIQIFSAVSFCKRNDTTNFRIGVNFILTHINDLLK